MESSAVALFGGLLLPDEGKETVPRPRARAGDRASDRGARRCCRAGRARRKARRAAEAVQPRPAGDATVTGGDARRPRAMTRPGDGADAVRLLPGHRQPGGSAVPPAPPPGRGVRGGLGRGGLGRGSPSSGRDARARRGPRAVGVLGRGGDAWACLCMGDDLALV